MRKRVINNLSYLKQIYKFERPEVTVKQLVKHKRLIDFLMRAPERIYDLCGSDSQLTLEYYEDCEDSFFNSFWIQVNLKNDNADESWQLEKKMWDIWYHEMPHYLSKRVKISVY